MSEISIGLIGAGMMGQEHIQNFNLLDGVCVGAIADTHAGMRDKAAAMCPHKVQTVVISKIARRPKPRRFVIATPNFHHIDVLRLGAGNRQADFVREASVHHAGRYA